MNPTRILIADDHPFVRDALPGLILCHGAQWEICGTASDSEAAIIKATELQPDIVIMDYKMPGSSGLRAAEEITRRSPGIEVLILTGAVAPHDLIEIFHSPVGGFMHKSEAVEELMPALEALRHHLRFRSQRVIEICERIAAVRTAAKRLSAREIEVLRLITDGKSSKEIATEMGISLKTVEGHRTHLFQKLQCNSVVELTLYAVRSGLVEP